MRFPKRSRRRSCSSYTLYNDGFWSKAFADPECTIRPGEQTFVWIHPGDNGSDRIAELCEWKAAEDTPVRSLCNEAISAGEFQAARSLQVAQEAQRVG